MKNRKDVHVEIRDDSVYVRSRSGETIIAKILGVVESSGKKSVYLDRLIHAPHENQIGYHYVQGAVSSILTV